MTTKPDCVMINSATLRWLIAGILSAIVMLTGLLWATAVQWQQKVQTEDAVRGLLSMHHSAIGAIARGCCPPEVRQSVSDIFFSAAQAGEKKP